LLRLFDAKFLVSSKVGQKFAFFGRICDRNVTFCLRDPKRHIFPRNDAFDIVIVKIGAGVLAVG